MSHVDTSIGFSLRSEPPEVESYFEGSVADFSKWSSEKLRDRLSSASLVASVVALGNLISRHLDNGWRGWEYFGRGVCAVVVSSVLVLGALFAYYFARHKRRLHAIRAAGFDSPVAHLTAEGQWVTFRFASGREFVDRWDRLLRFKNGEEFVEFEFPSNPPIIIPTSSIPEATRQQITDFCATERIPSETKR